MRLAITGGTGIAGRFILAEAQAAGDDITLFGRRAPAARGPGANLPFVPYDLTGPAPDLTGFDALIHAGFAHLPGRYRGGEGDDPAAFRAANLDGTLRLFDNAAHAGLHHVLFLSSRAVYGPKPPGTVLTEDTPCTPDTLYGQLKLAAEQALNERVPTGVSLRRLAFMAPARIINGKTCSTPPGRGQPVPARVATEVHGADLARALRLMLTGTPRHRVYNVSDLILDHADLLGAWGTLHNLSPPLPERSDPSLLNVMDTARLRAMGWTPGGTDLLRAALAQMPPR